MIYTITPLSVLIAVLVVFGMLNRSSELTAMKATGISLYRIVLPVLVIASILAVVAVRLRPALSAHSQPPAGSAAQRDQRQAAADL